MRRCAKDKVKRSQLSWEVTTWNKGSRCGNLPQHLNFQEKGFPSDVLPRLSSGHPMYTASIFLNVLRL